MKNIFRILITVIMFCSCTSSGKLTDAKFPYKSIYKHNQWVGIGYPASAGSYAVTVSLTDFAALKRHQQEYNTKVIVTILTSILIGVTAIFWVFGRKDETITMTEEFFENYKLNDNEKSIE